MPNTMGRKYLTLADAAAMTGLSVMTLRRAVESGRLKHHRPNGVRTILVSAEAVEAFVRGGETKPQEAD